MSNLSSALQQLRQEHKPAEQQLKQLQSAISVIEGLVGRNGTGASRNGTRPGRTMSAAGKARIAAAQRARWAKVRKGSQVAGTKTVPVKRRMSASARRKIAAAQRARWARV